MHRDFKEEAKEYISNYAEVDNIIDALILLYRHLSFHDEKSSCYKTILHEMHEESLSFDSYSFIDIYTPVIKVSPEVEIACIYGDKNEGVSWISFLDNRSDNIEEYILQGEDTKYIIDLYKEDDSIERVKLFSPDREVRREVYKNKEERSNRLKEINSNYDNFLIGVKNKLKTRDSVLPAPIIEDNKATISGYNIIKESGRELYLAVKDNDFLFTGIGTSFYKIENEEISISNNHIEKRAPLFAWIEDLQGNIVSRASILSDEKDASDIKEKEMQEYRKSVLRLIPETDKAQRDFDNIFSYIRDTIDFDMDDIHYHIILELQNPTVIKAVLSKNNQDFNATKEAIYGNILLEKNNNMIIFPEDPRCVVKHTMFDILEKKMIHRHLSLEHSRHIPLKSHIDLFCVYNLHTYKRSGHIINYRTFDSKQTIYEYIDLKVMS